MATRQPVLRRNSRSSKLLTAKNLDSRLRFAGLEISRNEAVMTGISTLRSSTGRAVLLAVLPLLLFATACDELGSNEPIEERDQTFQVSGPVTLDVETFNGRITVTPSDSNSVRVQATLKRADRLEYSAEQFGDDIQVKANRVGTTIGRSPSAEVEISAPSTSELILRTSNGAVEVRNFEAGANIRTSNGRVTVEGLQGELEVETSNGAIEVTDFTGSADLKTSNGSIRFTGQLVSGSENDMQTSNGSVTIDLDDNASIVFDGSTSNGSVSSDFPILVTSSGRSHLEGTIGEGDAELTARSSNGSITVR